MPIIYKRFTEKAADEWRQVYKALQLLEFLIKNGSERVIDDARSHISLLKMLRQFHYIDHNGKDQGLNVRNRAKELAELLSDVDRIRAERKKARSTRSKYTGVEGGANLSSGNRYGGFGNVESFPGAGYGGYSGGVYGDGGGYGGQQSDFQDFGAHNSVTAGGRDRFEEYDEFTEGAVPAGRKRRDTSASPSSRRKTNEKNSKKMETSSKKEPETDLFSFDDPEPSCQSSKIPAPSTALDNEDDFDEFQSAAPPTQPSIRPTSSIVSTVTESKLTQNVSPQIASTPKAANINDLIGFNSVSQNMDAQPSIFTNSSFSPPTQQRSNTYQSSQPNYFASVQGSSNVIQNKILSDVPSKSQFLGATPCSTSEGDAFGSLWSTASAGLKKSSTPDSRPALGQLAKERASAGIWANVAPSRLNTVPLKPLGDQKGSVEKSDLLG